MKKIRFGVIKFKKWAVNGIIMLILCVVGGVATIAGSGVISTGNAVSGVYYNGEDIYDKDSELYQDLLRFLMGRGQKSYLAKGYIKAALKYFFEFVK